MIKKIVHIIIYRIIMRNFLRLVVGVQFGENKSLRDSSQYVIVSNHNSHLDTLILLSALPTSKIGKIYPIAAGDYFNRNPLMGFFVKFFINTHFIDRNSNVAGECLDSIDTAIKKGKSLILFPEGSRGLPDSIQNFKKGIGYLLEKSSDVKFIPCYIDGVGRSLPKGDKLLVPFCIKLLSGSPVSVTGLNAEEINTKVYTEIMKLKEERGIYGDAA